MTTLDARLTGRMLIGGREVAGSGTAIHGIDRMRSLTLEPAYAYGSAADVSAAAQLAAEAFPIYRATGAEERATFLETVADRIADLGDTVVERAVVESGLPRPRIAGELDRTTGQLRLFAEVLREGSWNGARIDPAQPDRSPMPRADIRQRRVPLGPVAVFGASNFPLAFSVAGGDTASAFAAGCPVIVKAHDAHPGTSELVGRAIVAAVDECGLPAGVFALLFGDGPTLGVELVSDPRVCAVGFTGSRRAGLALVAAAARRPVPIPVHAEMSATNPVFLLPAALAARAETIAEGFVGSVTLGAGQFCTNPGLTVGIAGADLDRFVAAAAAGIAGTAAAPMLTDGIAAAFQAGVESAAATTGVTTCARVEGAALLRTEAATFLATPRLHDEIFGAAGIVVACSDTDELIRVARGLAGQLTASVHADDADLDLARQLLPELELLAGRIVFNGWPTGVDVGHAMVHGGPFPATSDSRTTSVGSLAIERFLRPVAYQDLPASLLPSAIADGNPDRIWRRIDGALTRD
jgi:alpha-ketoglutaric semialdehyde dehydrogenase